MEVNSRFAEISPAIRAGIDNLDKWYRKTDDTDAYFICLGKYHQCLCDGMKSYLELLVLDPNVKLAYAEDKWDSEAREDGIARLEAVVHSFANVQEPKLMRFKQFDNYHIPLRTELPEITTPTASKISATIC
jgi:hypothetical protein